VVGGINIKPTRRTIMLLNPTASIVYLFTIPEIPDENGEYHIEGLMNSAFNKAIDEAEVEAVLQELAAFRYDDGDCFEVTDDMYANGKIIIELEAYDRMEIKDITSKVVPLLPDNRYFVLVDQQRTDYQWIVAVLCGVVYSDDCSQRS